MLETSRNVNDHHTHLHRPDMLTVPVLDATTPFLGFSFGHFDEPRGPHLRHDLSDFIDLSFTVDPTLLIR